MAGDARKEADAALQALTKARKDLFDLIAELPSGHGVTKDLQKLLTEQQKIEAGVARAVKDLPDGGAIKKTAAQVGKSLTAARKQIFEVIVALPDGAPEAEKMRKLMYVVQKVETDFGTMAGKLD